MADIAARLAEETRARPAALALASDVAGLMVKAALFPLHIWLPDAHSIAPSPISAILSGLVVKMGIIGMLRVYQIFYASGELDLSVAQSGARVARRDLDPHGGVLRHLPRGHQADARLLDDLEHRLHRDGSRPGNAYGVIGGAVHVFNHALIKATLFLAAGALIYATGFEPAPTCEGRVVPCRSPASR